MVTNIKLIKNLKKSENLANLETLLKFNKYMPLNNISKEPVESFEITFKKVKDFLDVEEQEMPEIEVCNYTFSSLYLVLDEKILLSKNEDINPTLLVAHEFTHYLRRTYKTFKNYQMYSILEEGIARAVERHIAKTDKNKNLLIENQNTNHLEYLQVYNWLCNKLNEKPKEEFLGENEIAKRRPFGKQALGNTLFSLYEMKKGKNMYREMMKDKFDF